MDVGPLPTRIRATVAPVAGSTRATDALSKSLTQTEPAPAVTPAGVVPTWKDVAKLFCGSIRASVPSRRLVAQTQRSSVATPLGPFPTVICVTTLLVAGLTRLIVRALPLE